VLFRVSFLYDRFPRALQRALAIVYLAATMAFCAVMLWFTALMVWSSYTRGKVAATELQTPIYLPQMVLPIGFLVLLLLAAHQLLQGGAITKGSEVHIDETTGD
jgi:TRAP-type C4-dicarboxylate transport system permease small subunit